MQILLRDFADAGDIAHVERREKACFLAGQDPEDAIGLGLVGGDFRDQARGADADRAVQVGFASSSAWWSVCAARERRAVQALGAGHVEIGFVDRGHFDQRARSGRRTS